MVIFWIVYMDYLRANGFRMQSSLACGIRNDIKSHRRTLTHTNILENITHIGHELHTQMHVHTHFLALATSTSEFDGHILDSLHGLSQSERLQNAVITGMWD